MRMGKNGYRKFNDKFTLRKFEESMVDIMNDCLKGWKLKGCSSLELLVGKSLFHNVQQYLLPNFAI